MEAVVTRGRGVQTLSWDRPNLAHIFLHLLHSGEQDSGIAESPRDLEMENENLETKAIKIVPILNMLNDLI